MQPTVLPLWPGAAPGSEDWDYPERKVENWPGLRVVLNVARPTLTVSLPDPGRGDAPATGAAVVICPGGAFHMLAVDHEGHEVARWLNAHGIAAGVLKYRVVQTGEDYQAEIDAHLGDRARMAALIATLRPMVEADGQQAIGLMRQHAAEWSIDPARVGMMGFSAGAAVTYFVATARAGAERRPAFAGYIYGGGRDDGEAPPDAPPIFILCAADDPIAAPGAVPLYQAWRAAGITAELHIYARGGHGFGMRPRGLPTDDWIARFHDWLGEIGILTAEA